MKKKAKRKFGAIVNLDFVPSDETWERLNAARDPTGKEPPSWGFTVRGVRVRSLLRYPSRVLWLLICAMDVLADHRHLIAKSERTRERLLKERDAAQMRVQAGYEREQLWLDEMIKATGGLDRWPDWSEVHLPQIVAEVLRLREQVGGLKQANEFLSRSWAADQMPGR